MLVPVSVVVPAPNWVNVPVPVMFCPSVNASLRLMRRAALFVMVPLPSVPVVPPLPTCSVPALIVVVPL